MPRSNSVTEAGRQALYSNTKRYEHAHAQVHAVVAQCDAAGKVRSLVFQTTTAQTELKRHQPSHDSKQQCGAPQTQARRTPPATNYTASSTALARPEQHTRGPRSCQGVSRPVTHEGNAHQVQLALSPEHFYQSHDVVVFQLLHIHTGTPSICARRDMAAAAILRNR